MIAAPKPADERRRLATLRSLKVLDSPPEERFDRITRLARQVFDVPIALVSLVDADRQWFKSKQGLEVCETARDVSFCGHAILSDDVLVVEDARKDQRFADNPWVTGPPHIRFYAGYPVAAPNGSKLGTLCVIGDQPRTVSAEDRKTLAILGRMIESEMVALDLATNDSLTGLSNLRGFLDIGKYLLALTSRLGHEVKAVYVDVEGFGAFNRRLGMAAGDRALVEIAQALMASFRESDLIARVGGDEFCVLLSTGADSQLEPRLRRLDEHLHRLHAERMPELRVSLGVSAVTYEPDRHGSLEELIDDAAERLASKSRKAP